MIIVNSNQRFWTKQFLLFRAKHANQQVRSKSHGLIYNIHRDTSNEFFLLQVPGGPPAGGQPQPFKLNIVESIERIKEEFNFLQAQYHK